MPLMYEYGSVLRLVRAVQLSIPLLMYHVTISYYSMSHSKVSRTLPLEGHMLHATVYAIVAVCCVTLGHLVFHQGYRHPAR